MAEWDDAKRLFDDALSLEPLRREAYLRQACSGAPDLLSEVRSLLEWSQDSGGFLETPLARVADLPWSILDADPLLGQQLGAWRLVEVIGRGGMGVVYKAERADAAFRRPAAVKVVRRGPHSADIIERFRRERETLAALDHPSIARIMDAGTTPDGQPYFVMEYVDGVRIDEFCDANTLTTEQRLDLFGTVCRAVQYAHQTLVVHRDLKPDNILVSRDGVPKLLDFGIAKLIADDALPALDDRATSASWLMTPDYASPEQMAGTAVTTATDVYSLGVLLHVLLTGLRPYRLSGPTQDLLRQQLSTATLRLPSDQVAADNPESIEQAALRATTPRQLSRRLRGDLDAIILRALSQDLSTRYGTAEQLADELEKHGRHYPVAARGYAMPYLVGRFVRRHALALGIAGAVLALAVAGVAGILWQASIATEARARAERRFEDVRRLAHIFMFDVHDEIVNVPGTTRARALMVRTASEYLAGLAREAGGDLGLQRELAGAFVKVGDAQGHPTSANIGETAAARASYERAIEIASAVLRVAPDDIDAERTRAMAHRRLADVLSWEGKFDDALAHCELSGTLFASVASARDATLDDRRQAAVAEIKLGDLLGNPNFPNLGRRSESDTRYARALVNLRSLAAGSSDQQVRRYLGLILERIGVMRETEGQWPAAEASYQESFVIRRALAEGAPFHTEMQRDLAVAYEKLGNVQLFTNDVSTAAASYRGALAQFERLAQADPSNAIAIRSVAIARENVARALVRLGKRQDAVAFLNAALDAHNDLAARDGNNLQARCDAARTAEGLGDAWIGGRSPTALSTQMACSSWRASVATRQTMKAAPVACAAVSELVRLEAKLRQCPL